MNSLHNRTVVTMMRALGCAFAASLGVALRAESQKHPDPNAPRPSAASTNTGKLKHADRSFVEKASESGRAEVEIARIAADRSTNPDVKKLAQMLVDDHMKANEQLTALAVAKSVRVKDKDRSENRWAKKDAKDFDRDFVKHMVSEHKKDIDLFSKESKNGADPELVEFARSTLPKLEHHLEVASGLEKTVR